MEDNNKQEKKDETATAASAIPSGTAKVQAQPGVAVPAGAPTPVAPAAAKAAEVKAQVKIGTDNPEHKVLVAPEIKRGGFIGNIFNALGSLGKGMKLTLGYFVRPSTVVTQQYPENRETLKMTERFRAQLTMIHDENGQHKCTACGICQQNCPNGSINVVDRKNPTTGKNELDKYIWRMDTCTFCNLCVMTCPFGSISFNGKFESAVYDRRLYVYTLNQYAGPTAQVLGKIADPEERKKQMEPRGRYDGPVPLQGAELAGVAPLKADTKAADCGAGCGSCGCGGKGDK